MMSTGSASSPVRRGDLFTATTSAVHAPTPTGHAVPQGLFRSTDGPPRQALIRPAVAERVRFGRSPDATR
ncbi:hypothetical protein Atai01_63960 [Amycolatopsis taiwanensis]|uniref:Uncharacterized protein n=1 Tax=Amycolatopsis taiwanensis TaxID=342230 RepID=A0A9W6R924_9PSEU|nr:hypothetical protein Atai01_63960 [Amycolatopsis taiwanensis]